MSDTRAAYRYAAALIGVNDDPTILGRSTADMQTMEQIVRSSPEFRAFLKSPVINPEKKKKILTELLKGKVGDLMMSFVILLASKGRENLLPEIIREFYRLRDERLGILEVRAEVVVPLTKAQEQEIVGRIEKASRKKVRLTTVVNPALKGGFTVQAEDRVWDASVRHELASIKERWISGTS